MMADDKSILFGERDQELLFKAFAHLAANITRKSMNVIIGMIRLCIKDVVESSNITIPDAKRLDEAKRRELLENGIDEFLKRAKIGSAHRFEIRNGCLTIYERWRSIKSAIREERDIALEEILENKNSYIVGYDDQEVLLAAFAHYIHAVTGMERGAVVKLVRICMLEITIPRRINIKETRYLDEETRSDMIRDGIDLFIERARIDASRAAVVREDCLKVYQRWKEIRRVEPAREEIAVAELVAGEAMER